MSEDTVLSTCTWVMPVRSTLDAKTLLIA